MDNNKFTRLTLEQSDRKIEIEFPYEDVNGEDMVDAFKTIMVGMTFHMNTIESSMIDYLESTEKYAITKIEESKE